MTVDEFKDKINRKFVVKCDSISERNLTLELLIALGYEINEPSMKYLEPGNQDFDYPHPVMDSHHTPFCFPGQDREPVTIRVFMVDPGQK